MKLVYFGFVALTLTFVFLFPPLTQARTEPVPVTITIAGNQSDIDANAGVAANVAATLNPDFLGLSYESSMLLPNNKGKYYFDPNDRALVNTFRTLGIKNLRIGDDPHVPVAGTQDIDMLFSFARAAGVKVIYSFRLQKGSPAVSASLANYIATHDADLLDSFAIGNEPAFYFRTFPGYFAQWKPHYDAILKAAPGAMFDGPSVAGANNYALAFAATLLGSGHLAMASDHYYFLGSGPEGEQDPAATRERFLQISLHNEYEQAYARVGAILAEHGVPYRIDEMNSCFNGGASGASDTYASTLWALDCTHWWAAHHILGVNYHTSETVGRKGRFGAANYASFVHRRYGNGFVMRPMAYALLAFTQSARGGPLNVNVNVDQQYATGGGLNFDAYAYQDDDGSIYITLINMGFGVDAQPAAVSIRGLPGSGFGPWQRMDLIQKHQDIAAKTGIRLGGAPINPDGRWHGKWEKMNSKHPSSTADITVEVEPARATILRFVPQS